MKIIHKVIKIIITYGALILLSYVLISIIWVLLICINYNTGFISKMVEGFLNFIFMRWLN